MGAPVGAQNTRSQSCQAGPAAFASGAPSGALLEEAQEAQLAVVGRRGLGGVRRMRWAPPARVS
jgi:hypothetical protein